MLVQNKGVGHTFSARASPQWRNQKTHRLSLVKLIGDTQGVADSIRYAMTDDTDALFVIHGFLDVCFANKQQ